MIPLLKSSFPSLGTRPSPSSKAQGLLVVTLTRTRSTCTAWGILSVNTSWTYVSEPLPLPLEVAEADVEAAGCWTADAFGGDGGCTTTFAGIVCRVGVVKVEVMDEDHEGLRVCDVLLGMWGRA